MILEDHSIKTNNIHKDIKMKKNEKITEGLKTGTHKKCMACKKIEPVHNWAFDPNKATYACIHCGSSFYDPDMLKMVVVSGHVGKTKKLSFDDMLKEFKDTAERLKIKIDPTIVEYFKIQYDRNRIVEKTICEGTLITEWPFTIDTLTLRCYGKGRAITVIDPATGVEYALNGVANEGGYEKIDNIWREIDGKKVSLSDVIAWAII